jgi:hypothetical protein
MVGVCLLLHLRRLERGKGKWRIGVENWCQFIFLPKKTDTNSLATIMEIRPFESVGALRFGDSRQHVKGKLRRPSFPFQKNVGYSEIEVCNELGLHLYFDSDDCLEFVEAFEPAQVVFRGISFLGRELDSVISDMESLGYRPTESDVGVNFESAGIALTAPSGIVEGVAAHRKGYYDQSGGTLAVFL